MAVNQKALEEAMKAALQGPEKKKLKIEKHEFNVKPVVVTKLGDRIRVDGTKGHHISHHRSWAKDDQIYFGFEKTALGTIENLEVMREDGGLWKTIKQIWKVVKIVLETYSDYKQGGADDGKADGEASHEAKRFLDGSWEGEAKFLIANIALRVK